MTKEEINYMMKNGFTISEIMEMEKPLENLTKEDSKEESSIPVESDKAITEEAGASNKKKVSSDSSEDLLNHIKNLEETIKHLQDSNRQAVTIEAPEEYTADQAIKDLFENEVK